MRVIDERTEEILVSRDATLESVELLIGNPAADDARVVHLTSEEAHRLAALILFQAARLERTHAGWRIIEGASEPLSA